MDDGDRHSIHTSQRVRLRIDVRGIVQGVGFRPFVYRLASELGLQGWICNDAHGVAIEIEGPQRSVLRFTEELARRAPPLAMLDEVHTITIPPIGARSFVIRPSDAERDGCVPISPDIATCEDCLSELFDPSDRRYRYPFTNCTNCGPRLTIVEGVPYDRPRTTMKKFSLCTHCGAEYEDPSDRRFHAQPNACPLCGPKLWLHPSPGTEGSAFEGEMAIVESRRLLAQGAILAMKGLGGFHLACDAGNSSAVARLRARKGRVGKPFAVMVRDIEAARRVCYVDEQETALLTSPRRPIVLLSRREEVAIAPEVAPGLRRLGLMLPYTPLHHLIFEQSGTDDCEALVMTSGNLSEEPIAIDNHEALERLGALADYFLLHDRDVGVRCDDSVAMVLDGRAAILRRSRGYAPFPVHLPFDVMPTLACGGELKNTFCLASDRYAFLSQHIGDLENAETLSAFEEGVERYKMLFHLTPRVVAYDLHPDYLASRYAQELGRRDLSLRLIPVQHHHAHMASCMAENGLSERIIGVVWDGTGYGTDGAIWGGEFLVGDYRQVERAAHLKYVPLPGGDAATRHPYRMALSYLRQAFGEEHQSVAHELLARLDPVEVGVVDHLLATGFNSPPTSSTGRLFDAVAALLRVRDTVTYEGQAAIELEMLAREDDLQHYPIALEPLSHHPEPGAFPRHSQPQPRVSSSVQPGDPSLSPEGTRSPEAPLGARGERLKMTESELGTIVQNSRGGSLVIDVAPTIREIVAELRRPVDRGTIAARFHNTLAYAIEQVCAQIRDKTGLERVVLTGGVFQNQFLLRRTLSALRGHGFQVYIQTAVPCNDGGLALGQAVIAHARSTDR